MKKHTNTQLLIALMGLALGAGSSAFAGSETVAAAPTPASPLVWQQPTLSSWWNGPSALDQWFGLGPILSAHGLTVTGSATEQYFGQVSGGYSQNQPNSNFVNEEKINALLNFGKLFGTDALDGLTFSSTWRYRNLGSNPGFASGTASGPSATFNPTGYSSGLGVRILPQYLQWASDTSKDPRFLINAGWENPFDQFLQQPLSKDFENNAISSGKGIGATLGAGIPYVNTLANPALGQTAANGYTQGNATGTKVKYFNTSVVPWNPSYAAWGATLRIKPTGDTYISSGLYEAISQAAFGIPATQLSATQVYPYTQVPQSMAGVFNSTGLVYQMVGANGQPLYNANGSPKLAASGYIPGYSQNHGFNFQGSPSMNVNRASIGAASVVNQNTGAVNPAANYGSDGGYNSMNGLYNVDEIGWTPKFGADKLAGKYAIGGYIWGQENTSFQPVAFSPEVVTTNYTTSTIKGKSVTKATVNTYVPYNAKTPYATEENNLSWGMYFQADQRLYAVKEQVTTASLDGKNPVTTTSKVTDKGLYSFSEFTFTTPQNNAMPFYFQTGLVYKGLIPHRDNDSLGIVLGAGFYSSDYNAYLSAQNQSLVNALGSSKNAVVPNGPVQEPANGISKGVPATSTFYGAYVPAFSSTEVIEAYYKIQINKWASFSPDVQCIINPAGNGTLGNEWILGGNIKVTF